MANYVGEGLTILCAATDPATGAPITADTGEVEFYAPGKNPAAIPADRTPDQGPFSMGYDATVVNRDGSFGAYIGYVDTTGWAAGKWTYRVKLVGAFASWEYATVVLKA